MISQLQFQIEQIADGIAEKSYAIVDHFLSASEVDDVLNTDAFTNAKLQFKKAGIGKQSDKQINEGIRGDYVQWIEPQTAPAPITLYLERLQELAQYLNRSLFLSLKDAEIHMTLYPIGTFYKRHLDQFRSDDHRKISVICYLNKDWTIEDGGQLVLHLPEGKKEVIPTAGKIVCFRSDLLEHEVMPATRERLSLTGWLVDRTL